MPTITLTADPASKLKADVLVVGVAQGRRGPVLVPGAASGGKSGQTLLAQLAAVGATGASDEVTKTSAARLGAPVVLAVGLGPEASVYPLETLRRAAGAAARALAGTRRAAVALPAATAEQVGAVAEGALLGAYAFHQFRGASAKGQQQPVGALTVATDLAKDRGAKAALTRAKAVAGAVRWTRDLVNTPPNHLPPAAFADAARAEAEATGVAIEVLDDKALARSGYGGILGVGQGSANPPRLVRLAYRPAGATRHLALVGKGITFDSGGISIKPAQGMQTMKSDMAGAAAVLAATFAIARLGLPVSITAYAPMAENMPSGKAQRPSDVLTMYGGRTVEVLNTDAEGRLILADALVRAGEDDPDAVIDCATLTGAQLIALGTRVCAVMANDDDLRAAVLAAADAAGELFWPMPLPDELRKGLDSPVADIANIGERFGGMLSAGVFLREFVKDGLPWAHLDIAGPSYNEGSPHGHTPKGGTGVAVRTLVTYAETLAGG